MRGVKNARIVAEVIGGVAIGAAAIVVAGVMLTAALSVLSLLDEW